MAIAEAWFCAQWPIFVLFLRFVFGLLSGWKIQTWFIIRFLKESVTYWFFYLLVFDRIHDVMCLNKMSRTSSRNIGPQKNKNTAVYFIVHMGYFLSLCSPNPSWVFAAKNIAFFCLVLGVPIIWEKHLFYNDISPFYIFIIQRKVRFLWFFINKISKELTKQIHFHSLLWSYLPRVPIFLAMAVHIFCKQISFNYTNNK